jgi:hypothetical protein
MDDAPAVRDRERIDHRLQDLDGFGRRHRTVAVQVLVQVDARQVLHDQVRSPVGQAAKVQQLDDVGVPDLGDRAGLPLEAQHDVPRGDQVRV